MSGFVSRMRDLADVARRAGPVELLKAALPPSLIPVRVLNDGPPPEAVPASEAARRVKAIANRLKAEAISEDGRAVDYRGLRESPLLAELQSTARLLRHVTPDALASDAERVAFWVNLYNVLTVHGIVALGIRQSVMEVPSFFSAVAYRVGEHRFTLDEIENGVLRRNGRHPATRRRFFADDDPRLAYSPSTVDARIHFALVCAARGCPPIAHYEAATLDAELDLAARAFVNGDVRVEGGAIRLSALFRYYPEDFGGEPGLRRFLVEHADEPLANALAQANGARSPLAFRRYDWTLNSAV